MIGWNVVVISLFPIFTDFGDNFVAELRVFYDPSINP